MEDEDLDFVLDGGKGLRLKLREDLLELGDLVYDQALALKAKKEKLNYKLTTSLNKQKTDEERIERFKFILKQITNEYWKLKIGEELFIQ